MEGLVDYSRSVSTTDSSKTSDDIIRTEERLTLRNVGAFLYHPRVVTFDIGGTFGLSQEWFDTRSDSTSREETRDATLWGYSASAFVLPGQATSLNLFANRDDNIQLLFGGGRTETRSENRGARLFLRRLYIPSVLTFRQESREDETRTGGVVSRTDEDDRIISYEGDRGWLNSAMNVKYEFTDHSDQVVPERDFKSHQGDLFFSLDFGPELNWRWDSRQGYFSRSGEADVSTLTVNQTLVAEHTDRLRTNYGYSLTATDTKGGRTSTHTGTFGLTHRLYENLTTTFGLDGSFQTLEGGERQRYGGRVNFAYTKGLPGGGRLGVGLGGALEYEDDRFDVTESFVPQEPHTFATPFALPVSLDNPFVVTSSVVVTKVALGPLPLGCTPFSVPRVLTEGVDYTLRSFGDVTEIVPLPCTATTPGINPGDTIAADYRFTVSPSLTFTTAEFHADMSVDYGWIRPFFIHEQTEQTLLSGRDEQFLEDKMSDTIGVELRHDGERLRANVLAEAERSISDRQSFDAVRVSESLTYPVRPELTLALTAGQGYTDFSKPQSRQTWTLFARADLNYRISASLAARAFAGSRYFQETGFLKERTTEAGLELAYIFRKFEVRPTFKFTDRQRDDTSTQDYQLTLRIIRWF